MSETAEEEKSNTLEEDRENKKISISRAHNFIKHYVTNIDGGLTSIDFRYQLMNEKFYNADDEEWIYIADALVILSPVAAKRLFNKLEKDIDTYEAEHGVIQTNFEKDLTY